MKFTYSSGQQPLDGYTIKRGIGGGGFGEVYYGLSDGGKEVALKLIRSNVDIELRGMSQCLNFKHPNLVELYDLRTDARRRPLGGHGIRHRRDASRHSGPAPERPGAGTGAAVVSAAWRQRSAICTIAASCIAT